MDPYSRNHDSISYISPERAQAAMNNMPVPIGMFMNMTHVPPRFYQQHQQSIQGKFAHYVLVFMLTIVYFEQVVVPEAEAPAVPAAWLTPEAVEGRPNRAREFCAPAARVSTVRRRRSPTARICRSPRECHRFVFHLQYCKALFSFLLPLLLIDLQFLLPYFSM
jgi:hypothetical protein